MKYLIPLIPLVVLTACNENRVIDGDEIQNGSYAEGAAGEYNDAYGQVAEVNPQDITSQIQGDPDRIVLSDFSQEQQARDRAEYAAQLDIIEANRVDITGAPVAQVDTTVNVAAYARTTTNQIGIKVYERSGKKGNCRAYGSPDSAQRAFLANGGPATDSLGLDRDGDGFACEFNPSFYRRLSY